MKNAIQTTVLCTVMLAPGQLFAGLISNVSVTGQVEVRVVQIAPGPLGEDALAYTDRIHEWNDLPAGLPQLQGAEYIMTANDDRDDPNLEITVTLSKKATLYMFLDTRIAGDNLQQDTPLPWMTNLGLVDTGFDIGQDTHGNGIVDVHHSIYSGTFGPGDVVFLSENRQGVAQYGIAAIAVVPEPSSFVLLGIGGVALIGYGWRRKRKMYA